MELCVHRPSHCLWSSFLHSVFVKFSFRAHSSDVAFSSYLCCVPKSLHLIFPNQARSSCQLSRAGSPQGAGVKGRPGWALTTWFDSVTQAPSETAGTSSCCFCAPLFPLLVVGWWGVGENGLKDVRSWVLDLNNPKHSTLRGAGESLAGEKRSQISCSCPNAEASTAGPPSKNMLVQLSLTVEQLPLVPNHPHVQDYCSSPSLVSFVQPLPRAVYSLPMKAATRILLKPTQDLAILKWLLSHPQ